MSLWSRIAQAVHGEHLYREIEEGLLGAAQWMVSLVADVRFGARQFRRNKITFLAAVFSLALGFGSCVAAFCLLDALLWRPLPVSGSSRLYVLSERMTRFDGRPVEDDHWSTPAFRVLRQAAGDQAELMAISDADRTDITWTTDEDMEKAHVAYVSGNMFPLFGLQPALGRLLGAADDRARGAAPYVVLSWDYWNLRFGRDPRILGRPLHIGDQVFEIIGVGPREFTGIEKGTVTDIFVPLDMNSLATQEGVRWHRIVMMLKPGVAPATAVEPLRQHLSAVSRAFQAQCSECLQGMTQASIDRYLAQKLVVYPAGSGISALDKEYRRLLGVLGLLAALVLVIACVNVANLLTAQAAARAQEMALRISMGAGRGRLVQLILAQCGLLALLSCILGSWFAGGRRLLCWAASIRQTTLRGSPWGLTGGCCCSAAGSWCSCFYCWACFPPCVPLRCGRLPV